MMEEDGLDLSLIGKLELLLKESSETLSCNNRSGGWYDGTDLTRETEEREEDEGDSKHELFAEQRKVIAEKKKDSAMVSEFVKENSRLLKMVEDLERERAFLKEREQFFRSERELLREKLERESSEAKRLRKQNSKLVKTVERLISIVPPHVHEKVRLLEQENRALTSINALLRTSHTPSREAPLSHKAKSATTGKKKQQRRSACVSLDLDTSALYSFAQVDEEEIDSSCCSDSTSSFGRAALCHLASSYDSPKSSGFPGKLLDAFYDDSISELLEEDGGFVSAEEDQDTKETIAVKKNKHFQPLHPAFASNKHSLTNASA